MHSCSHKETSGMVSFIGKGTENIAKSQRQSVGCPHFRVCVRLYAEKGGEDTRGKEWLPVQGRVPVKLGLFCLEKK